MKIGPLFLGGVAAGLVIIAGEAILNLVVLADEWDQLFLRFALPRPTPFAAAQGVLKLLLLGIFSVWLSLMFKGAFPYPGGAGAVSGLCIWFLVWAWVQWGMLLAGYVTVPIAVTTVAWGGVELPVAAGIGTWLHWRLSGES